VSELNARRRGPKTKVLNKFFCCRRILTSTAAEETLQAQQRNCSNSTVERKKEPQVDSNKTDIKCSYVETHLAEPRTLSFFVKLMYESSKDSGLEHVQQ